MKSKNSKAHQNPNTQTEVDQFHLRAPIKSHGDHFYSGCSDKQVRVTQWILSLHPTIEYGSLLSEEGLLMSIAGSFQVIINSPLGDREATLNLDITGEVVSGSLHSKDVVQNFFGGAVNGNEVSWEMDLTRPISLHLICTATVKGDSITGVMKLGAYGDANFSGTRI